MPTIPIFTKYLSSKRILTYWPDRPGQEHSSVLAKGVLWLPWLACTGRCTISTIHSSFVVCPNEDSEFSMHSCFCSTLCFHFCSCNSAVNRTWTFSLRPTAVEQTSLCFPWWSCPDTPSPCSTRLKSDMKSCFDRVHQLEGWVCSQFGVFFIGNRDSV